MRVCVLPARVQPVGRVAVKTESLVVPQSDGALRSNKTTEVKNDDTTNHVPG